MSFRLLPRPALPLAALLCAVAAPPASAGFSDGTIPDAIAACQGVPYDIVERDGDLYVACHGTTLDWMRFSATVSVDVDDAAAHVTVTRTGTGSGRRALLRWSTADGTAQAGRDYASVFNAPLYFDDLETSRTITVPLIDDPAAAEPRSFSIAFSNGASQNLVVPGAQTVTLPFATPAGPAPQLAGRARAGEVLTATAGPWSPGADAVAWRWERCDAEGGGCAAIDGATAATLTLRSADAGRRVRAVATATNAAGATTATSAASDVVRPVLAAPSLSGPPATTRARSATFSFAGEPDATFECRLDDGAWSPCASPHTYAGLTVGAHALSVRQQAADGAVSPAAEHGWEVLAEEPEPSEPEPGTGGPGAGVPGTGAPGTGAPGTGGPDTGAPGTGGPAAGPDAGGHGAGQPGTGSIGSRPGRPVSPRPGAGGGRARRPVTRPVVVTATVRFCAGCWRPSARDRGRLEGLRERVRGSRLLQVVGHADASGEHRANVRLAGRRARVAARLLLGGPAGTRPRRVEVRNAGVSRPAASNDTLAGRALNRRVTIRIVAARSPAARSAGG